MPINILMPALSPTMEKGNLAKWLKKEGDKVKSGDVIAEIETDKATMEVEAVDEGTIAKILVPEGTQDVPVNDVIAVLAGDGEDVKAAASAGAAPAPKPAEAPKPAAAPAPAPAPAASPKPAAAPAPAPQTAAAPAAQVNGHARIFSSPLARRLAKDAGIDLARITGTGPHGRVIARDVEDAKSGKGLKAPAAAPGAAPSIAPSMSDKQILALFEPGSYDVVPHDGMRRTIAQRLTASVQSVPHFYLTIDCDIGKLLVAREEINASAPKDKEKKPLYKLSVNDFVIKAMAVALQKIPNCNVSWTESGMLKHKHSDVGVAVAMPGGLITPIIRKAETKTLSTISNEMKDFATRARARKLKPEEYQGGTTAVSNLGMYGINHFTAVINPPHATILAVGTSEERPVVRGGKIEIAHMMSVTLSCDHRAIDGALGAELIGAFKQLIENPVMMMV
ncbi:pyruvate dehydrogenase complex dihydrolipoamide acetyltransferase [Bradyrhizobium sp. ISRA443]|uniref:pyruvate dehydrogenase complex dihydrolipoamide acetyltransferase n=1 Tax=unclassified Bradyrhizobium TaxID=2631580 RepID=UPI00247A7E4B|nr:MULTISPECIES: pyruvate dehydrogenase complex dihydrolipoamide acetyltransferase [unclassified Bradyrhizobium]WGR92016.1 pyruvate dehydrogenase complex dihydrolipoamide acetyltransferase [Bradyrhizobium sp. ISRA435]WGS02442.1 pyruvate dehydrogenase complex dihydrolipoamide acetyltransferase [Bradyrhizobium sp. ISRA436]WGS09327.1 pyruvate dehydrogenase complex dihydrolipoamide acetyltransferase [Bradyrhizobium sp. ISRA437]WGS16216.1 pyruvate dehydrogenase complex dihydrolipoamide acetyltransfe